MSIWGGYLLLEALQSNVMYIFNLYKWHILSNLWSTNHSQCILSYPCRGRLLGNAWSIKDKTPKYSFPINLLIFHPLLRMKDFVVLTDCVSKLNLNPSTSTLFFRIEVGRTDLLDFYPPSILLKCDELVGISRWWISIRPHDAPDILANSITQSVKDKFTNPIVDPDFR